MNEDIAKLRHRAFAVKLALRRLATFHTEMKRARLSEQIPELEYFVAAPQVKVLFDEVVRLSLEAERTVNAYAKLHYGFAPGDNIQMGYPISDSPIPLRVHKVFLQSGTDSDIRVDASCLQPDGAPGSRWDVYLKAPGVVQFEKVQRKEEVAR